MQDKLLLRAASPSDIVDIYAAFVVVVVVVVQFQFLSFSILHTAGHVKIVKAAMGDANLTNRLRGVSRLFIVTPGVENRADLAIKTAQSAKAADVKSLVVVSVLTADKIDTVFGRQFKEVETSIKNLGVSCTFLRLPIFQENYWALKDDIVNQSCIYMPLDPTKPYTPVVVSDAGRTY